MLKHGFLIMAHNNFDLLDRIIYLLSSPNHYFFINIDKKSTGGEYFIEKSKKRYKNLHFLEESKRIEVSHGGFSMVKCTIKLLEEAKQNGMDYFHLISGQDFPCQPNYKFDIFFEDNKGKSFMHLDTEEEGLQWKNKWDKRVKPFYFLDIPGRSSKIIDNISKYTSYISSHFKIRKNIENLWGGWNWFSWHKTAVDFVLNYLRENPKFLKRFRFTSSSDELIFATLLKPHAASLNLNINNALRYIDWEKHEIGRSGGGSPLILTNEEFEDIMKSNAFFCRKVHPEISKDLLNLLENHIKNNY